MPHSATYSDLAWRHTTPLFVARGLYRQERLPKAVPNRQAAATSSQYLNSRQSISPASHRYLLAWCRQGQRQDTASIFSPVLQYLTSISPSLIISPVFLQYLTSHDLSRISPGSGASLARPPSPGFHQDEYYFTSIQYFTRISHQDLIQYFTSISPGSHQDEYLTRISPVSHQYLTAWRRQEQRLDAAPQ